MVGQYSVLLPDGRVLTVSQLLRTLDMWYSFLDRIWWMKSNIFQAQVAYSDGPICDFPYKSTLGYKVPSLYDVAS